MKVNIRQIAGNWDVGFVLDKHTVSSSYTGDNQYGHPTFSTIRSEVGEALYQLKYRNDWSQVTPLANVLATTVGPRFGNVGLIIPMPASNSRARQPVFEIAIELGKLMGVPVFDNIIAKSALEQPSQLKDMSSKDEKAAALVGRFSVVDAIPNEGRWNVLLVDDLYDTGASMEAASTALRSYRKIDRIYVAALTWK